jgi:SET domain-containing protein
MPVPPCRVGGIIEQCPVIVVPKEKEGLLESTTLYNYTYGWGEDLEDSALALGFGSRYNHAYRPNAMYKRLHADTMIAYVALRDIAEGEEITVNYNGRPEDVSPLWFKVAAE